MFNISISFAFPFIASPFGRKMSSARRLVSPQRVRRPSVAPFPPGTVII
jgi:hypothetical protein